MNILGKKTSFFPKLMDIQKYQKGIPGVKSKANQVGKDKTFFLIGYLGWE